MKKKIEKYFDRLFELNRSITGKDYIRSLDILSEIIPLKKINFHTGSKVGDWRIPMEWNVKKAYLENKNKEKIIDFEKNNLHLIGYSSSFRGEITFRKLKKNLFYIKKLPKAIPYVTSYYKKRWGLCLSYDQFKKLNKKEKYFVNIETNFKKGNLTIGEKLIKGKSNKEILISSYLCHPSMANNELSGPLTLAFLYNEIKNYKFNNNIRFCIQPETIGSITYINKFIKRLKKLYRRIAANLLWFK